MLVSICQFFKQAIPADELSPIEWDSLTAPFDRVSLDLLSPYKDEIVHAPSIEVCEAYTLKNGIPCPKVFSQKVEYALCGNLVLIAITPTGSAFPHRRGVLLPKLRGNLAHFLPRLVSGIDNKVFFTFVDLL
jgi:hypothetical protein